MPVAASTRPLHPLAWWAWGITLAAVALRGGGLLTMLSVAAAAGLVVWRCAPNRRVFGVYLRLGVLVIVARIALGLVFAPAGTGPVLWHQPQLVIPIGGSALRFGGDVHLAAVLTALDDGLRIATVLLCVGAANALCDPTRLLRAVPSALYEAGVAVVVGLSYAPALAADIGRVRAAQQLRGRPTRGLRAYGRTLAAALDGSLERAVALAGAMDAKGYGRRGTVSPLHRALLTGGLLTSVLGLAVGAYGATDSDIPPTLSASLLLGGGLLACLLLVWAGHAQPRTRYRAEPWGMSEWAVLACTLTGAGLLLAGSGPPPADAPGAIATAALLAGALIATAPSVIVNRPGDPGR